MTYQKVGHFFIPCFIGFFGKSVPLILGVLEAVLDSPRNTYDKKQIVRLLHKFFIASGRTLSVFPRLWSATFAAATCRNEAQAPQVFQLQRQRLADIAASLQKRHSARPFLVCDP